MPRPEGVCLCGQVRYAVGKDPIRVTVCHCRFCQRATGGAYMIEPVFEEAEFTITSGGSHVYEHVSEGSGKRIFIHFCPNCGTKLYLSFQRFPGLIGVYGGTFDDPNWFEIAPENSKQVYLGVARRGTIIPPHINTFVERTRPRTTACRTRPPCSMSPG